MGGAYFTGAPIIFCLFGIPSVLIGLFLLFGRFFTDAHIRGRTCYGITNERISSSAAYSPGKLKASRSRLSMTSR